MIGVGWLASLNGYAIDASLVCVALFAGVGIALLRVRLGERLCRQFVDPGLIAFALSASAMLLGVEFDLGPRGLAVLASWCVTTPWSAVDAVLAKVVLLPTMHALMLAVCVAHMLFATPTEAGGAGDRGAQNHHWWRRCQRCALVLLTLPAVLLATDFLVLGGDRLAPTSANQGDWLSVVMVLMMAIAMSVCSVAIQHVLPVRRA